MDTNCTVTKSASTPDPPKLTILINKYDSNKHSFIKKEIESAFNDPSEYLNTDNHNIIVNKLVKFPRLDKNNNIKPYSIIGTTELFAKKISQLPTFTRKSLIHSITDKDKSENKNPVTNYLFDRKKDRDKENKEPVNYISDVKLEKIYDKFKDLKNKNAPHYNEFMNEIDSKNKPQVKQVLNLQEKILKKQEERQREFDNMSKIIALKTNKREDEILMNRTDGFRIKKEISNTIDLQKNKFDDGLGNNKWIVSLRRPENFSGIREAYFNSGTKDNPSWVMVKEKSPDYCFTETVRLPNSKSWKEIQNYTTKSFYMGQTISDFNKTNRNFNFNSEYNDKWNYMTVYFS
jgi:hypothetical protein